MNDDQAAVEQFVAKGTTRLFPLPNLVFFPQGVQPLHIFEPRYRQMISDALGDDRLLTVVLLRPGWEDDYEGRPPVYPVACLGRIIANHQLPDGRYNLLVRGIARLRLVEELPSHLPYRLARGEVLADGAGASVEALMGLRNELAAEIVPRFQSSQFREHVRELFAGEMPLGSLCDVLAFALPIPTETKQAILEQPCVEARAQLLLSGFRAISRPQGFSPDVSRRFPPEFSPN